MIRTGLAFLIVCFGIVGLNAQQIRPLTTYTVGTKVSPTCGSIISLTLFEQGSGNDKLNEILINEFLGNFMQAQPIKKLKFFYQQRQFTNDTTLEYSIYTAVTFNKNDLISFTKCYKYACDKEEASTYETEMITIDATAGKVLEMNDFFESNKMDSLKNYLYKIVTMYRIRSLPTCKVTAYNPNQIVTTNGASTGTDLITYQKGISNRFYLSEDKIHLYNKVTHRDYDYEDVELAIPMNKLTYFLKPEMAKRLGL